MGRLKALRSGMQTLGSRVRTLTREEAEAVRLKARDANSEWRGWYKTARWRKLRLEILDRDGWTCRVTGVLLVGKYPADDSAVVDHIRPHRGDAALFWDPNNLHSVSKAYHDSEKQRIERGAARS